jgi:hypothetical protein
MESLVLRRTVMAQPAPMAGHRAAVAIARSGVLLSSTSGASMAKAPKETLLERERFELKPRSGGGLLSYEVWGFRTKGKSVVTRYNLAYVNHKIFQADNGRVLGFDNAHGYHHRHHMGQIESVEFVSYETTLERFQREWFEIVNRLRGKEQ